jgi:hypothetical protein
MGKIRSLAGVLMAAAACMACGGEADAHKKRVRELEEELTRLQNTHDRLDERITSLELSRQVPHETANPPAKSAGEASEQPQTANLERPPLKVFRLAPAGNAAAAAPVAVEEHAEEETGEPRPLIRGRGQNIEKAPGTPAQAGPKARPANLSQNDVPKAK